MRDDVLGAFGDESLTGKPVGDDLREGKPTPLLAIATERASAGEREVLATVGAPDLTPEQVGEIQSVLVGTGALDELERRIDRLLRGGTASHRRRADHRTGPRRARGAGALRLLAPHVRRCAGRRASAVRRR